MGKSIEIERKFMVKHLPDNLESYAKKQIQQGYLFVGGEHEEVRLRRTGNKYYLTIKKGTGLVRSEHEIELTNGQFEALWPTTMSRRLEKTRFNLPGNIELDVYHGDLEGLVTAEVE